MAQRFFWSQVHAVIILVLNTCTLYLTTHNSGWHLQVFSLPQVCAAVLIANTFTLYLTTQNRWHRGFSWSQVHALIILVVNTFALYLTTQNRWHRVFFWSQVHALIILVVNTFALYLTTQNTGWHRGFSGPKYVSSF